MGEGYIKKNGLIYSEDMHTVLGVDDTSNLFTGMIPFGARSIDDEVFSGCPYESFSVPDSVTHLGKSQFKDSKSLENVKLSSVLTKLPPYLFAGCSSLTKVTMPNVVDSFPEGLFMDCESLRDIPFRAGIKELPPYVFAGCKSLKSLVIPPTVQKIETKAVADCVSLESVVIPASVIQIAPDAFEGCTSIHNIRVEDGNTAFYINEQDGCLYSDSDDGDIIVIRCYKTGVQDVSFYKDNIDDEPIEFLDDEDFEDDDTFFSSEIGTSEAETEIGGLKALAEKFDNSAKLGNAEKNDNSEIKNTASTGENKTMSDSENVDSMLADIMESEKERSKVAVNIGVSDKESEILSETMSVMADVNCNTGAVSKEELEKLFAKNEENEISSQRSDIPETASYPRAIDSKVQILLDSAKFSKVNEYQPKNEVDNSELFIIAENIVKDENGNNSFSKKLMACCNTFARIHDLKRIVLLYGLPMDNDEFAEFFHSYIKNKNIIVACEASSPSNLSAYCKAICDKARISLDKDDLNEQRKNASIKTNILIKLIIRDKYE